MEIQEETITKRYIEFDGIKFYPDKKGYWLGHISGKNSPVRVWKRNWRRPY